MKRILLIFSLTILLSACSGDPNEKPIYGETGLPKNCRAIVQANVDAWRSKQYSTKEIMNSLERNCGANGYSWGK